MLRNNKDSFEGIGLMSGSSLDGLDIALCQFQINEKARKPKEYIQNWSILKAETVPFDDYWLEKLKTGMQESGLGLLLLHTEFGRYCGQKLSTFIKRLPEKPDYVASHGHTLFHLPNQGLSFQLGCGATMAAQCGLPIISDFRMMDVAMGGQGAPLAPVADKYLLREYDFFLNLGGIANITVLNDQEVLAYDICGANQTLNALARLNGHGYDDRGHVAASGKVLEDLLQQSFRQQYFQQSFPKSLSNEWVENNQTALYLQSQEPVNDRLKTAAVQIARLIAWEVKNLAQKYLFSKNNYRLLATGGGAYNDHLIALLTEECQKNGCPTEVVVPDNLLVEFKEAALMSLLGLLRIQEKPNCLSSVTGARSNSIGGAVHWISNNYSSNQN